MSVKQFVTTWLSLNCVAAVVDITTDSVIKIIRKNNDGWMSDDGMQYPNFKDAMIGIGCSLGEDDIWTYDEVK